MAKTYQKSIQIRFRDGDPARIMYFANIFSMAHDTFEDMVQDLGLPWKEYFTAQSGVAIPIRHTQCDYLSPLLPGEHYQISVSVAQIRETSFQMKYRFHQGDRDHAIVKMVHACLDLQKFQKTPVPERIKNLLNDYLEDTK